MVYSGNERIDDHFVRIKQGTYKYSGNGIKLYSDFAGA